MNFNGQNGFGSSGGIPSGPVIINGSLTVDGSILMADGKRTAPSLTYKSGTDTGWYKPGDGFMTFESKGTDIAVLGPTTSWNSPIEFIKTSQFDDVATFGKTLTCSQPFQSRTAGSQTLNKDTDLFVDFSNLVSSDSYDPLSPATWSWADNPAPGASGWTMVYGGQYNVDTTLTWPGGDAGIRRIIIWKTSSTGSSGPVATNQVTCSASEQISLSLSKQLTNVLAGDFIGVTSYQNSNPSSTYTVSGSISIKKSG